MYRLLFFVVVLSVFFVSCVRDETDAPIGPVQDIVRPIQPMAVLQAGAFPLWFRVTPDRPVLIETIEDAVYSAALIPWPFSPHVRFILAAGDDLMMAVNHSGFIRLSPRLNGIELHYISGGELWRDYTVGAFFALGEKPHVLLYRDDIFADTDVPVPSPRLLTFSPFNASPKASAVSALDAFPSEDGWNVDSLRLSGGYWYFRAVNRESVPPQMRMFRGSDLLQTGNPISVGVFQNSARPEPLSAAPPSLGELLAVASTEGGLFTVASPEFQSVRRFAVGRSSQAFYGFYSTAAENGAFLIATDPHGEGLYVRADASPSARRFSLPPLPEGFVYTGIGLAGDTVFAVWEEQEGHSIGAAGFMTLLLTALID